MSLMWMSLAIAGCVEKNKIINMDFTCLSNRYCHSHESGNLVKQKTLDSRFHENDTIAI